MYIHLNMARQISPEKLENLKLAVLSRIAKFGYSTASVATIAKEAGVSDGYLYRFYKTKEALVQAIYEEEVGAFHSHIHRALEDMKTAKEVISAIVGYLIRLAIAKPESFRFIDVMLHDPTFTFPITRLESIRCIAVNLIAKGHQSQEFDTKWQAEDLFVLLFSVPLKFIDSRLRGIFQKKKLVQSEQSHLTELLFAALSKKEGLI